MISPVAGFMAFQAALVGLALAGHRRAKLVARACARSTPGVPAGPRPPRVHDHDAVARLRSSRPLSPTDRRAQRDVTGWRVLWPWWLTDHRARSDVNGWGLWWRWWLTDRRARSDAEALADVVDDFAAALDTGMPAVDALAAAAVGGPAGLAASLGHVVIATRGGLPFAAALQRWADGPRAPDGAALVAAAFGIAAETGGDAPAALAGVGATLRERRELAREVRALASQARSSALVVAAAPVGFAAVSAGFGGETTRFLLGSQVGLACLLGGLGLDAAGWRWMRRITKSVQ